MRRSMVSCSRLGFVTCVRREKSTTATGYGTVPNLIYLEMFFDSKTEMAYLPTPRSFVRIYKGKISLFVEIV